MFACADEMALGAYEALYERGARVPDDISIVGFDDLDSARWAAPPLTTVRQPLAEMAGMATRMLLSLIAGEGLDSHRIELATPLIVRHSTRACPDPTVDARPAGTADPCPPGGRQLPRLVSPKTRTPGNFPTS